MIVGEMSRAECLRVLAEAQVARLACASENQPYIVPVYLAYYQAANGDDVLYGFTTLGQKVDWMRANPRVCVEVDQVSGRSEWSSVVAFGRFEEIPNIHEPVVGRAPARSSLLVRRQSKVATWEPANEQLLAHKLLDARAMWWEPASSVRTGINSIDRPTHIAPVFYKIRLTQVTGYRARREDVVATSQPDTTMRGRPALVERWKRSLAHWLAMGSPWNGSLSRAHQTSSEFDSPQNVK